MSTLWLLPAQVNDTSQGLSAAGLYGGRITVERAPLDRLPFAPYVFNLVIDERSFRQGRPSTSVAL